MTTETKKPDLGSDALSRPSSAKGRDAEAQPAAADLVEVLKAATDSLQQAASCAVQAVSEAVAVASFCGVVQRCSVHLSLQPEHGAPGASDVGGLAESMNRGAQKSLSAIRRLGEHQRVLLEGLEQVSQMLVKVAEELDRCESRRAQERFRALQDQRTNAELAQKIATHARNINQIMDQAWPLLREHGQ